MKLRELASNLFIPQLDGNFSISDPVISPSPGPSSGNMLYPYALNTSNQSTRLVTNASKPPVTITQNNLKTIRGATCATNVTMEFNSGVYITAIKPVLNSIKVGWKTIVSNWDISCTKLSNREDITITEEGVFTRSTYI